MVDVVKRPVLSKTESTEKETMTLAERLKKAVLRATEMRLEVDGITLIISRVPNTAINHNSRLSVMEAMGKPEAETRFMLCFRQLLLGEIFKHLKGWEGIELPFDAQNVQLFRETLTLDDENKILNAYDAALEKEEAAAAGNGNMSAVEHSTQ